MGIGNEKWCLCLLIVLIGIPWLLRLRVTPPSWLAGGNQWFWLHQVVTCRNNTKTFHWFMTIKAPLTTFHLGQNGRLPEPGLEVSEDCCHVLHLAGGQTVPLLVYTCQRSNKRHSHLKVIFPRVKRQRGLGVSRVLGSQLGLNTTLRLGLHGSWNDNHQVESKETH